MAASDLSKVTQMLDSAAETETPAVYSLKRLQRNAVWTEGQRKYGHRERGQRGEEGTVKGQVASKALSCILYDFGFYLGFLV